MGWDGSGNVIRNTGVFQGATAWQQTQDVARKIRADDQDVHDEDLASSIENAVARDGQNSPTDDLPMGGKKHTDVADATSLNQYPSTKQVQNSVPHWCTVGGTANAIVLTSTFTPAAYTNGQKFIFVALSSNTGAVTVNVNNLGAVAVKKREGLDLDPNDIVAGGVVEIYYDGGAFQLTSYSGVTKNGDQTITESDNSANAGPTVNLMRESASPTADDLIGEINLKGRAANNAVVNWARVRGRLVNSTDLNGIGAVQVATRQDGVEDVKVAEFSKGVVVGDPIGGDKGVGSLNCETLFEQDGPVYSIIGRRQAALTGDGISKFLPFTGIPSGVTRVVLTFDLVEINDNLNLYVQLGDDVIGYPTGVYVCNSLSYGDATVAPLTGADGFMLNTEAPTNQRVTGHFEASRVDTSTNIWTSSHTLYINNTQACFGSGRVVLTGEFNSIRVGAFSVGGRIDAGRVGIYLF